MPGFVLRADMNGLLLFALLFKEIENKRGVVNECYFAVNVKVAGSIPAFWSNPIVAQLVEQEHRKVHNACEHT